MRTKRIVGLALVSVLTVALTLYGQPVSLATAQSPLETPVAPASTAIVLTHIEPRSLLDTSGGTLSVYGSGFTTQCVVRLVGYGLLSTTFVNETAMSAQIPAGVPAGRYTVEVSNGSAVTPREPGPATIAIRVGYHDAFNQMQTLTTTLTANVAGDPGNDVPPYLRPNPGDRGGESYHAHLLAARRPNPQRLLGIRRLGTNNKQPV